MKAPFNYIISTTHRYNNTTDSGLVINTEITERDGEFVNRVGTVVGTPLMDGLNIPMGSKVIVHHNTFRRWYDVRGNERNGASFWNENEYIVDQDLIYAYDSGDGWVSCDRFAFIKPLEDRIGVLEHRRKFTGHVCIGNEFSPPVGSLIAYAPDSDYFFEIDGEKMYRVYIKDICILFNESKREEKADTSSF